MGGDEEPRPDSCDVKYVPGDEDGVDANDDNGWIPKPGSDIAALPLSPRKPP